MSLAVAGVALAVAASSAPAAPAPAPSPARLQVLASEFNLTLSRQKIRRGPAVVELVNFGEDDHDLRLRRLGSKRTKSHYIPVLRPGRRGELELRLRPGRYRLWCSVAGHRELGMESYLVVRKKKGKNGARTTTVAFVPSR